jgi:hypothetical protein
VRVRRVDMVVEMLEQLLRIMMVFMGRVETRSGKCCGQGLELACLHFLLFFRWGGREGTKVECGAEYSFIVFGMFFLCESIAVLQGVGK